MSLMELVVKHGLYTNGNVWGTDKEIIHGYVSSFYEDAFAKYRDKEINLIEVGVYRCFSIKMWREYFPKAKIWASDIEDDHFIPMDGVEYFCGDSYSDEMVSQHPNADIIIDDGPHTVESQILFLQKYLPKLNKGGTLVVEDVQSGSDHVFNSFGDTVDMVGELNGNEYDYEMIETVGQETNKDNRLFVVTY
jgi:hypothetical protein